MSGSLLRKAFLAGWVVAAWVPLWATRCPAGPVGGPASKPAAATAPAVGQAQETKLAWVRGGQADKDGLGPLAESGRGAMWRMLAYMLVIVVLGVATLVVIKRVLPRIGVGVPSGKRISTLETAHLGPRKTVYLLQIGAQKILIGSSREGLSMLADVTKAFDEPQADPTE